MLLAREAWLGWLLEILRVSLALVWIGSGVVSLGLYPVARSLDGWPGPRGCRSLWLQIRMRDLARKADADGTALPPLTGAMPGPGRRSGSRPS